MKKFGDEKVEYFENGIALFIYALETVLELDYETPLRETNFQKFLDPATEIGLAPFSIFQVHHHGLFSEEVRLVLNSLERKGVLQCKRKNGYSEISIINEQTIKEFCKREGILLSDYIDRVRKLVRQEGTRASNLAKRRLLLLKKAIIVPSRYISASDKWREDISESEEAEDRWIVDGALVPGLAKKGLFWKIKRLQSGPEKFAALKAYQIIRDKELRSADKHQNYRRLIDWAYRAHYAGISLRGKTCFLTGRFKIVPMWVEKVGAYKTILTHLCCYDKPEHEIEVYIPEDGIKVPIRDFVKYAVAVVGVYDYDVDNQDKIIVKALGIIKLKVLPEHIIETTDETNFSETEKRLELPEIKLLHITDTKKESVKLCLVQLSFPVKYLSAPSPFGITLKNKEEVKDKVFKALKIADEQKVDIIIFPELSSSEEWIEEIKCQYKNMIIIGGSYYNQEGENICPIVINGEKILYKKVQPSPIENPESTGRGMKSGNCLYVFQTECGRFSVLLCSDFNFEYINLILHHEYGREGVDFIINPRYEENMMRAQELANTICRELNVSIIQVNSAFQEGKSCIIAKEHDKLLFKYQKDGIKPLDNIKYKLCQLEGEVMLIAHLNLKAPPVEIPLNYSGRLKIENVYKYDSTRKNWISARYQPECL